MVGSGKAWTQYKTEYCLLMAAVYPDRKAAAFLFTATAKKAEKGRCIRDKGRMPQKRCFIFKIPVYYRGKSKRKRKEGYFYIKQ